MWSKISGPSFGFLPITAGYSAHIGPLLSRSGVGAGLSWGSGKILVTVGLVAHGQQSLAPASARDNCPSPGDRKLPAPGNFQREGHIDTWYLGR